MKHKTNSWHTISRNGYWWCRGKWVIEPENNASSVRTIKTLKKLDKEFNKTPYPATAESFYRKGNNHESGSWFVKWSGIKRGIDNE